MDAPTYQTLLLERREHVAVLTLNRPDRLNAFNDQMRNELVHALDLIEHDDDARVLVVTGAGRGFCTGADVGEQAQRIAGTASARTTAQLVEPRGGFVLPLWHLAKPTIAAVNGVAAGGGFSIALLCDIRIASDQARFIAAWSGRALVPDIGATFLLPRLIGVDKALEIFLTGATVTASQALALGIVTHVEPAEQVMQAAFELAVKIAAGPPVAQRFVKRAVYAGLSGDMDASLQYESYAQAICYGTQDHQEGVKAFTEKRLPRFQGR